MKRSFRSTAYDDKCCIIGKPQRHICQYVTNSNFDRVICFIELSDVAMLSENKIDETLLKSERFTRYSINPCKMLIVK